MCMIKSTDRQSVNLRIKQIREYHRLMPNSFAKILGVEESILDSIEDDTFFCFEKVNISLLCQVFNINENWLRTGEGQMFVGEEVEISKLRQKYCLNDFDVGFIIKYMKLCESDRRVIEMYFRNIFKD